MKKSFKTIAVFIGCCMLLASCGPADAQISPEENTTVQNNVKQSEAADDTSASADENDENQETTDDSEQETSAEVSDEEKIESSETEENSVNDNNYKPVGITDAELSDIDIIVSEMTLHEKICQLFIVTPEQLVNADGNNYSVVTQAGGATKKAVEDFPVSGVIFFGQNVEDREQLIEMNTNLQKYAKYGMFIAVDEEGGEISRIAANDVEGFTAHHDMSYYGEQDDAEELVTEVGDTLGRELRELGFNVDFAPVADVNISSENTMGERMFSDDPALTGKLVSCEVEAMQNQGVCATLKHFPGLGATESDTHYGTAVLERDYATLSVNEFVPFRSGIRSGAEFIMVGHAIATGLGETEPSDLSHRIVTEILKNELGFNGIAITDAHTGMASITDSYSSSEATVASIKAGIDIVLMPDDLNESIEALEQAASGDPALMKQIDKSVGKILSVKKKYGII